MNGEPRLDQAMRVFLDCLERELGLDAALAAHPELGDLLQLLFEGNTPTSAPRTVAPESQDPSATDDPRSPAAPAEAEEWFGHYRIDAEIGRGGVGTVYLATQRSLGRRVAIKVLRGDGVGPTQVARFRREAMTLARLDHPNIVGVLDVGETRGRHWLAMEYVEGESLDLRLEKLRGNGGHRGSSLRHLIESIAAIAEALHYVHERGILHRDVKPSNILLRLDGTALLSDFGLARDTQAPSLTHVGVIAGTPHYMSPEHLAGGDALQPGSDVFSLGATLYECLTLERPFDGETNEVVLRKILGTDPVDPRRLAKDLHQDLAAITLCALEKDPARRYGSAAAFAADLRAFLDLRPVRARTPSTVQKMRRWLRREPMRAGLLASLLLCTGLLTFLLKQWSVVQAAENERIAKAFETSMDDGWLARTAKREAEAIADFRRALAIRANSAEAIAGLCMSLRAQQGIEVALQNLDRLSPGADDPDLLVLARELMLRTAGHLDEANRLAQEVQLATTPTALWFRGTCELMVAERGSEAARRACEKVSLAVRLSPRPRLTLVVQWAVAAYFTDDRQGMLECARTLQQLWPEDARALHYAALTMQRSDLPRALELCRRARALGMNPDESHWLEVVLLQAAGRSADLLPAIEAALQFPWDDARRSGLIELLSKSGGREQHAKASEAWYREAPDNLSAMRHMAITEVHREAFDRAIPLFEKICAARPDDADALYDLAAAQHMGYRDGEARANLERVLVMAPGHERAHGRLLDMLGDSGDPLQVRAELGRWAEVRKQDVAAQLAYATALLDSVPSEPAKALDVATRADYLAGGKNADVLEVCGRAHAALGEVGPAARLKAAAARLRPGH